MYNKERLITMPSQIKSLNGAINNPNSNNRVDNKIKIPLHFQYKGDQNVKSLLDRIIVIKKEDASYSLGDKFVYFGYWIFNGFKNLTLSQAYEPIQLNS